MTKNENSLRTNKGIIHRTEAEVAETRTNAKPACSNRKVAGWVSAGKKEALVIEGLQIEHYCPKCW